MLHGIEPVDQEGTADGDIWRVAGGLSLVHVSARPEPCFVIGHYSHTQRIPQNMFNVEPNSGGG